MPTRSGATPPPGPAWPPPPPDREKELLPIGGVSGGAGCCGVPSEGYCSSPSGEDPTDPPARALEISAASVAAALLTAFAALLIVLVTVPKLDGKWCAPLNPTGRLGPIADGVRPALGGGGAIGAALAGPIFGGATDPTPTPTTGGASVTGRSPAGAAGSGPSPHEVTGLGLNVGHEGAGSGFAVDAGSEEIGGSGFSTPFAGQGAGGAGSGVVPTTSDGGGTGSGAAGVWGPYWSEGAGWGVGQASPGTGMGSDHGTGFGDGSGAARSGTVQEVAGAYSTTSPLTIITANCCGAGAGMAVGGSGTTGPGTGAGSGLDGIEPTGDGEGSSAGGVSFRGTFASSDSATSPSVITTFEDCCCGVCSAGCSFAWTSRPATKRETMDKTSATTRARVFRLRGSIRLVVILCGCTRGKSLGASYRFGGVPDPGGGTGKISTVFRRGAREHAHQEDCHKVS